ncbi:G-patch domain - like 2 [Theobroma cacao]|nr:G-patch domain - like 2 [Theobroma cacao]
MAVSQIVGKGYRVGVGLGRELQGIRKPIHSTKNEERFSLGIPNNECDNDNDSGFEVMSFGLKNAGAIYQRAMVTLFHDMMHKEVEVYLDDMIVKAHKTKDHATNLERLFERLRKFWLRLNPTKCTYGVTSRKLLGFIVSKRGIEVDPDKVKEYLLSPPVLVPPVARRPLILYLTVNEGSIGCVLAQHDETGKKERAVYYLSKKFTKYESKYSSLEKMCCALAWTTHRLRQYMLYHTTWLIVKLDPIKYIFKKPSLSGRVARWQVLLSEYDIVYVSRKAIKGNTLADFLAERAEKDYEPMKFEFSNEDLMSICQTSEEESEKENWNIFFDEASNALGHGIGVVLVSPERGHYPIIAKLNFSCTNNTVKYEACVMVLQQYPEQSSENDKKTIRRLAMNLFLDRDILYKRSRDQVLLRCVDSIEARRIVEEVHEGIYGAHASGHMLARQVIRAGYYWLTLETDCIDFAQKCQIYADKIHTLTNSLNVLTSPWPFSMWGMDVIGLITPKA